MSIVVRRRFLLSVLWIFLWGIIATALSIGVNASDPVVKRILLREVPDQPPGIPAQPDPNSFPTQNVTFGPFKSIQVNVDVNDANIPGDASNEPSIAVDPTNPLFMSIGWRQFDTNLSNFREAGVAYTRDGGRTWTFPQTLDNGVFRSDPVLGADAEGNFYYSSLKVDNNVFEVGFFRSTDGGLSWNPPVFAWGGDKQWFTIDHTGGQGHGNIYQAWNVFASAGGDSTFNRSIDGAASFEIPLELPEMPLFGTVTVDSAGVVYINGIDPDDLNLFRVVKSVDAKNPAVQPTFSLLPDPDLGGVLAVGAGPFSPNPDGLLGMPWIAADRSSGTTSGYLYMLCSVDPPGIDPLDIHFIRSEDGGLSWSAPVRINDDSAINGAWQWFGTMSVSPNGRIDVVWNDTRGNNYDVSALYYSASSDGGVTWSPNVQASPTFNSHLGWPQQNKIGDYYDMVSDVVGADLAWSATFNGEQDTYYLRINDYDCNVNGVGDSLDIANQTSLDENQNGIPDECEPGVAAAGAGLSPLYQLLQNVPNPFIASTTIRFQTPITDQRVTVQVFDVRGRLVRTLFDRAPTQKTYSLEWDGTNSTGIAMTSGLYITRLTASGFSQSKKIHLRR